MEQFLFHYTIGVDGTTYEIRAFREEIKAFNPRLMQVRIGSQMSLR